MTTISTRCARLGAMPMTFPSGHGGFLGNEYGQPDDPAGFAATLLEVLEAPPA